MFAPYISLSLGLAVLSYVSAEVFDVQVGKDGLTFEPEAFSANPGDQVVFHFHAKNHTATQSAFDNPCGPKEGGFDSGFMPVAANITDDAELPTYTITIQDTNPVWVYCKQAAMTAASHCGAGMVFSVNCPSSGQNSFANFKQAALDIGASLQASASSSSAAPYGYPSASSGEATAVSESAAAVTAEPTLVTETITLDQSSIWTTTYSSYPGSPAATPASAEGDIITVTVGAGGLVFNPSHVTAKPRDTIVFEFHAKNHTVTQSTFASPCTKSNATTAFDSGFMPVDASLTEGFPTWNLTVNDTAPLWFYCKQKTPVSHCQSGMVFAVNAVEGSAKDFNAFQKLANESASATNTSSASGTAASATPTGDGALAMHVGTAGIGAVVIAALAALL